jgi:RNA polymerase sigma-70 factor, ECF subfamily
MADQEQELLREARSGDQESLGRLLELHRRKVLAMLRARLGHNHDAEDACQDALLAASRTLDSLRDDQRFGAWLLGIAFRRGIDIQRKRGREQRALRAQWPRPEALPSAQRTELNLTLIQALEQLPDDQRSVLALRYHGGLSYREIASVLDLPTSTVRGAIYRAMQRLRRDLRPSFDRTGPARTTGVVAIDRGADHV